MGSVSYLPTNSTGVTKRRSFHTEGNGRSLLGGGGIDEISESYERSESPGMELSSLLTDHLPPPHAKATKLALQNLVLSLAVPVPQQQATGNEKVPTPNGSKWLRWFKKRHNSSSERKEKVRADKAYMHATVTVAGVAAAILGVTSKWAKTYPGASNYAIPTAMTSAAELLAAHLVQLAHQTGADHPTLASTIQSGINVTTSTDLITLTAAAATSLRAAAVLKDRMQIDRSIGRQSIDSGRISNIPDLFCKEGPLRKKTRRGLCWKHLNIYMNKDSQIILKIKKKHRAASLFKTKTSVVYGVQEVISGRQDVGMWFLLNTDNGFMEFLCETEIQKQKWVAWVKNLMHQASVGRHQLIKPLQKLKMS
ncbi:hypothetical protein ZOSMA_364G00010 [Zostera marina]|uniref:PH domain-containing protein n=1 Tax=Zostera marina TaxID=29655 RepID=A0A0K9P8N4_ZOSMR|nr:hypothetical protein ZOSMA_364G00010 [Zostera marina]